MLAEAVAPYGGIIMWRAFVYNPTSSDRANQAVEEFKSLDGQFADNVIIQIKNGPIDFQPREPFSPLFGQLYNTPMMMEFQITQEYLGFSNHLVYHGTTYEECLDSDTYRDGKGSTIAKWLKPLQVLQIPVKTLISAVTYLPNPIGMLSAALPGTLH